MNLMNLRHPRVEKYGIPILDGNTLGSRSHVDDHPGIVATSVKTVGPCPSEDAAISALEGDE